MMELGVVGGSIHPHSVDDFEPAVTEPAYSIGVAVVLLAVMVIVNVGPDTTGEALLSKKIDSVTEVFVTSPALMNVPVSSSFSGTLGHRGRSAKALQSLSLSVESLAVISNLGEQARSELGSSTRQGTKQLMIGMTSKEFFDALAINSQLLFNGKEHLYETQSQ